MVEQLQEKLESDDTPEFTDVEKEALAELKVELKQENLEHLDKEDLKEFIDVLEGEKKENDFDDKQLDSIENLQYKLENVVESKDKGVSEIQEVPFDREKEVEIPDKLNQYLEKAEIGNMKVGDYELENVLKIDLTEEGIREKDERYNFFIEDIVDEIENQNSEINVDIVFYTEEHRNNQESVNLRKGSIMGLGYFGGETGQSLDDALKSAISSIGY